MSVNAGKIIWRADFILIISIAFLINSACLPPENHNLSNNRSGNSNAQNKALNQSNVETNNINQASLSNIAPNIPVQTIDSNSPFAEAARRNLETERNLKWLFGKRPQIGWYLYKPLIAKTIGVEPDASPTKFAEALARWQKSAGLQSTGILDEITMFAFVGAWQKNRLFSRGIAESNEMLIGSPDYFYDPGREETLRQVDREAFDAYRRMIQAAAADPSLKLKVNENGELAPEEKFLKIVSAFRTKEYQEKLREASPNSGRAGLAVNSPHFTGRALDIYVGGEPVSTADENRAVQINTPVYRWLVKNAEKFGFRPYFYEPWHWEYVPD